MSNTLKLGTAKIKITPQTPLRLCGYATRTGVFSGVLEDLFLRVHAVTGGKTEFFIFGADILWWNSQFVERARAELQKRYGLKPGQLFFTATHNHSGPPTGATFTEELETFNATYADFLLERVCESVPAARENSEAVELRRHDGLCALNVFRRVNVNGEYLMRPNYDVPADRALTVAAFYRSGGSLKGALVHYACHANISNENYVQPDYPGITLRRLDETFAGCITLFLQGCTADLRPNCVLGDRFTPFGYEKTAQFAEFFYESCIAALKTGGRVIEPQLCASRDLLDLPLENIKPEDEIRKLLESEQASAPEKQWAQKVLEKNCRPCETADIGKIVFGSGLCLYTINAEVSQYYAAFVREQNPGALFAGYTNGMIGYLSTAEQIAQGGYEPKGSALYFALAGTFKPETEKLIHERLKHN